VFLDFISSNFTYTPIVNLLSWRDIPCFCSDPTFTDRASDHILGPSHYWFPFSTFQRDIQNWATFDSSSILPLFKAIMIRFQPWKKFHTSRFPKALPQGDDYLSSFDISHRLLYFHMSDTCLHSPITYLKQCHMK
jgi:hypothetical protein